MGWRCIVFLFFHGNFSLSRRNAWLMLGFPLLRFMHWEDSSPTPSFPFGRVMLDVAVECMIVLFCSSHGWASRIDDDGMAVSTLHSVFLLHWWRMSMAIVSRLHSRFCLWGNGNGDGKVWAWHCTFPGTLHICFGICCNEPCRGCSEEKWELQSIFNCASWMWCVNWAVTEG